MYFRRNIMKEKEMSVIVEVNAFIANESKLKNNCITNCFTDNHCLAKLCGESIALNYTNWPLSHFKICNYISDASDAETKYSDTKPKEMNFESTVITSKVALINQQIKSM